MDQQAHNINEGLFFCEDCRFRLILRKDSFKCGRTGKLLRFYDRACEKFKYSEPETREFEYDSQRKAYVVK